MANIFLNGGSPNYTGFEFSNATQLIDQIETTLVAAGWVTDAKVSGVSLFIRGETLIGSYPCYVDFIVSGTSPTLTLTMRGWLEQTKVTGSPDAIHTTTFSVGGTNRMWLSACEDAGAMVIFNSNGACVAHHFGFPERVDTGDPWAWMVGRIHAFGYLFCYSAKSAFNGTNWRQLSLDYVGYSESPLSVNTALPVSTFDATMRGQFNNTAGITSTVAANPFYLAGNGKLNYNGKAKVTPDYEYAEGKGNFNAYGSANVLPLFFRGYIKFAACGLASLVAASQTIDPVSGNRYISGGGSRWQGMRIL